MACYTMVMVTLSSNVTNRKARQALGLAVDGPLSAYDARRVRIEAGIIKARREIKRMNPSAIIRRKGNRLFVKANVYEDVMAIVNIEISFDYNGEAIISIPHGKNQQRNANKAASFTDRLSKALGDVKERHIGDHEHHDGDVAHRHNHRHHHH